MHPDCQKQDLARLPGNQDEEGEKEVGLLELSDSGRLRITGICDLYVPPSEHQANRSLAVIVAGLYRTNAECCRTQMQALIANHGAFARVDVFAYMLYTDDDINIHNRSRDSIEAAVRECYGPHLRRVEVYSHSEIEEDFPGGETAMLEPCGSKLRRLNNQLKTVDQAGRLWRQWAIENGFMHDTVLRLRPDTGFRSPADPPFWSVEELGTSNLVLPHPAGMHYYYCPRMSGRVGVGSTDQIAYGSPAAMGHWLSMYQGFAEMVGLASNPSRPAYRDFSGCEALPTGPNPGDCADPAPCSIECLVAWYLESRGISFGVEWGWNEDLVR
ncbi:hypothetical protein HRG_009410 [Hirsutella rhossiliensis]|uniref:Uncharacterized protein n=1 Tax=Hirsutella rhossiliensis TaxID=111463 RepID=A0A9P8SEA3_9HYPO|nr:uncharacterized protein HRG_09410 [Hirsutella rhossiliensis]KAH0959628.1 hypothetical protein HRG_09410 [Hirsutella rhossiliensis]